MEFRQQPLGFIEGFCKTTLIRPQGSQSKFHELNICIKYIFIYQYYIIALS